MLDIKTEAYDYADRQAHNETIEEIIDRPLSAVRFDGYDIALAYMDGARRIIQELKEYLPEALDKLLEEDKL